MCAIRKLYFISFYLLTSLIEEVAAIKAVRIRSARLETKKSRWVGRGAERSKWAFSKAKSASSPQASMTLTMHSTANTYHRKVQMSWKQYLSIFVLCFLFALASTLDCHWVGTTTRSVACGRSEAALLSSKSLSTGPPSSSSAESDMGCERMDDVAADVLGSASSSSASEAMPCWLFQVYHREKNQNYIYIYIYVKGKCRSNVN